MLSQKLSSNSLPRVFRLILGLLLAVYVRGINVNLTGCNISHGRYNYLSDSLSISTVYVGDYNTSVSASSIYCNEGHACSVVRDEQVCVACDVGLYCPVGTIFPRERKGGVFNICPAGYYCQTSAVKKVCPPGYACGIGTSKLGQGLSKKCLDIGGGKIGGLYCPAGTTIGISISFNAFCSRGYYCPKSLNYTAQKLCPAGHFCYGSMQEPMECGKGRIFGISTGISTSDCPPGSIQPSIDIVGIMQLIIIVCFTIWMIAVGYAIIKFQRLFRLRQMENKLLNSATKNFLTKLISRIDTKISKVSSKTGNNRLSVDDIELGEGNDYDSDEDEEITEAKLLYDHISKFDDDGFVHQSSLKRFFFDAIKTNEKMSKWAKKELEIMKQMYDDTSRLNIYLSSILQEYGTTRSGHLNRKEFCTWYYNSISDDRDTSNEAPVMSPMDGMHGFSIKEEDRKLSFNFEKLGLTLKSNGKSVLRGVSGEFNHSQLIAVMGPSGAGKSSFLNRVCGRSFYANTSGKIYINGKLDKIQNYCDLIGFVPQDDTVFETLTVYENFMFSSYLRRPNRDMDEHYRVIEDVIHLLELDHVRDTVVGSVSRRGISGGQRKRVNIGVELVSDPSVLFLDEPTSGLDATSAKIVISALKDLAKLGTTVVAVIHQPRYSIFTLFDQLLLLGKGGATVYNGPTIYAEEYFESIGFPCPETENVADFILDVCAGIISRQNSLSFVPEDLFDIWESVGMPRVNKLRGSTFARELQRQTTNTRDILRLDMKIMQPKHLSLFIKACKAFMTLQEKDKLTKADMILVLPLMRLPKRVENGFKNLVEGIYDSAQTKTHLSITDIQQVVESYLTQKNSKLLKSRKQKMNQSFYKRFREPNAKDQKHGVFNRLTAGITTIEEAKRPENGTLPDHLETESSSSYSDTSFKNPGNDHTKTSATDGCVKSSLVFFLKACRSFVNQYAVIQYRYFLIKVKGWRNVLSDILVCVFGGLLAGIINKHSGFYVYAFPTALTLGFGLLGVLSGVGSVNTFGDAKNLYFRERSWGLNAFALCCSRMVIDGILLIVTASVFATACYDAARPLVLRSELILVCVCTTLAASPIGYICSIIFSKYMAQVISAVGCFIIGAITSGLKPNFAEVRSTFLFQTLFQVSYGRYAVEAIVSKWARNAPDPYNEWSIAYLRNLGYSVEADTLLNNCTSMFFVGLALRFVTYILLVWVDRYKQHKATLSDAWAGQCTTKQLKNCCTKFKEYQQKRAGAQKANMLRNILGASRKGNFNERRNSLNVLWRSMRADSNDNEAVLDSVIEGVEPVLDTVVEEDETVLDTVVEEDETVLDDTVVEED